MKKIITICAAILMTASVFAQAPNKMSYQAVIRNNSNALVANQAVGIRISILQGSSIGTALYTETQTPTTNANGLASIEIGGGAVVTGNFSTIDWANGPYFIKTETDPNGGTSYTITGTSQLLSVPYALHAKTAETVTGTITETDPVFGISVASGITGTDTTNWNNKLDTEIDGSITNEIQTLSLSNQNLTISSGNTVTLPDLMGNNIFVSGTVQNVGSAFTTVLTVNLKAGRVVTVKGYAKSAGSGFAVMANDNITGAGISMSCIYDDQTTFYNYSSSSLIIPYGTTAREFTAYFIPATDFTLKISAKELSSTSNGTGEAGVFVIQ